MKRSGGTGSGQRGWKKKMEGGNEGRQPVDRLKNSEGGQFPTEG